MKSWQSAILIIVVAGLAYGSSLLNTFVWDDNDAIADNYLIRKWSNLPDLVSPDYFKRSRELSYRPLVTFTYFCDYALWGLNPTGYHVGNVLWHVATALALWQLVLALTRERRIAIPAALLFAAHPAASEAVNVAAFREDLMAGFAIISALGLYLRLRETSGARHIIAYVAALVIFAGGLLAKEMAASLPLLIAAYELAYIKKGDWRSLFGRPLLRLSGFLVVLGLYLGLRFVLMRNPGENLADYAGGSLGLSILTTSRIFATYIKLMILPFGFNANYTLPASRSLLDTDVVLSLSLIAVTLWMAFRLWPANRVIPFAIAAFYLSLLPVSNIIPIANPIADRYLYVPAAFFCIGVASWLRNRESPTWVLALLLIVYTGASVHRSADWRDSQSIWSRTAEQSPENADVYHELGDVHYKAGRLEDAIGQYAKCLALNPNHFAVRVNLGVCYDELGRPDLALEQYRVAVALDPSVSKLHNNIGNIHFKNGDRDQAMAAYTEAIRLDPHYPEPYLNLAVAYMNAERADLAVGVLLKALDMAPQSVSTHLALARAYVVKGGETERAIHHLQAGLAAMRPDDPARQDVQRQLTELRQGSP